MRHWIILLIVWFCLGKSYSQDYLKQVQLQVINGDTMYVAMLHDVYVYPTLKFKNKSQERFYWRTIRDVKKTLPFAKKIKKDMVYADEQLAKLGTKKERKKWWRSFEKHLYKKYENDF